MPWLRWPPSYSVRVDGSGELSEIRTADSLWARIDKGFSYSICAGVERIDGRVFWSFLPFTIIMEVRR